MTQPLSTQVGVFSDENSSTLKRLPIPTPGPRELLVQNVVVASNPKDWKHPKWENDYSYVEGSDVAGHVAALGDGVDGFTLGQRVAAFTKMGTKESRYGGYAQYSLAPASTTIPIPNSTSFEEASTLPLAIFTAAIGLFVNLSLREPPAPGTPIEANAGAVIVYGASSSVGVYVVQLAKCAGYFVVGVAGSSCDYARELGADIVVDYRAHKSDAELEDALVKALSGRSCSAACDTIVTGDSTPVLAGAIAKASHGGRGKVTHLLPLKDDAKKRFPPNVEPVSTFVGSAFEKDETFCARFSRLIPDYLAAPTDGKTTTGLRPNRVRVVPNGLAGVGEGLALLKDDKVHGEKLVYRVIETPGVEST
ncbi:hypothetical protein M0805_009768 [Coniferiporia weirii]|nr:hypothetical protein M0805_009768 [Coniferiporia weirii]